MPTALERRRSIRGQAPCLIHLGGRVPFLNICATQFRVSNPHRGWYSRGEEQCNGCPPDATTGDTDRQARFERKLRRRGRGDRESGLAPGGARTKARLAARRARDRGG